MTIETAIQIWRTLGYIRRENIDPVREALVLNFSDPAEIREVCLQPFTLALGKGPIGVTADWIRHNRSKGKIGRSITEQVNVTPAQIRDEDFLANLYFAGHDPVTQVPTEQTAVQAPEKYPPLRPVGGVGPPRSGFKNQRSYSRPTEGARP